MSMSVDNKMWTIWNQHQFNCINIGVTLCDHLDIMEIKNFRLQTLHKNHGQNYHH